MAALRQVTITLPDNLPLYEGQDSLVKFTHSTTYDYHFLPPPREQYIDCSKHLTTTPFQQVLAGIAERDAEKLLDLGLRYFAGCTTDPNIERALATWELITQNHHKDSVPEEKLNSSILGRAFSCIANANMDLMWCAFDGERVIRDEGSDRLLPNGKRDPILANDFLWMAAENADAAAACGLVSPAVLYIARWLTQVGERDKINIRETTRYKPYVHLWRAWDIRQAEMAEEKRKRDAKIERAPSAYVCAAQGCGITAGKKTSLLKCAGRCPVERKPHYCSKTCQRKDWKNHKRYCKPDRELGDLPIPRPASPSRGGPDIAPALDYDPSAIVQRIDYEGQARSIEMPIPGSGGRTLRIHSKHLTPEALRLMRDYAVAKSAEAEAAKDGSKAVSNSQA